MNKRKVVWNQWTCKLSVKSTVTWSNIFSWPTGAKSSRWWDFGKLDVVQKTFFVGYSFDFNFFWNVFMLEAVWPRSFRSSPAWKILLFKLCFFWKVSIMLYGEFLKCIWGLNMFCGEFIMVRIETRAWNWWNIKLTHNFPHWVNQNSIIIW